MSKPGESILDNLQFYTTASYPCSYLPGKMARSEVAAPTHLINPSIYSKLIKLGFRRSGLFTYRPSCDTCQACKSLRVNTALFKRNRTQQKLWHKMQSNLVYSISPLYFEQSHFDLYRNYQQTRHAGAGMDTDDQDQYQRFLLESQVNTKMVQFYDQNLRLKIISIIDYIDDGISAVYTFFDPQAHGSLGTYAILWLIEYCKAINKPWLYLGYWLKENSKMAYKVNFKPYQILDNQVWSYPENINVTPK